MIGYAVLRDDIIVELSRAGLLQIWSDISETVILRETLANQDFMKGLEGTLTSVAERVVVGRRQLKDTEG
jgi:hypothetical protein